MKQYILLAATAITLASCTNETLVPYDIAQKPAAIEVKGYSKPDSLQMKLNGQPVLINKKPTYAGNITTKLEFVVDEGETDILTVNRKEDGKEIAKYIINYGNLEDFKTINFFNLPGLFLQTSVTRPTVNLGRTGFEFIFPNLGENGVRYSLIVLQEKDEAGQVVVKGDINVNDYL